MDLEKNNSLFTDLTEDETAALNGGHFCVRRFVRRCFIRWTWYGRVLVCRFVPVIICY